MPAFILLLLLFIQIYILSGSTNMPAFTFNNLCFSSISVPTLLLTLLTLRMELHVHRQGVRKTLFNVVGICSKDTHVVKTVGRINNHVVKIVGRGHMKTLLNVVGLCSKDTHVVKIAHVVKIVLRIQPGRGHIIGLCSKDTLR